MADDDDDFDFGGGIDDEDLLAVSIDAERASMTTSALAPPLSTCTSKDTTISGGHHAVAAPAPAASAVPAVPAAATAATAAPAPAPAPASAAAAAPPKVYRFTFGKHINKTLREVPPSYIRYLTKQRAHESRPDLLGALTELAYTIDEERTALLLNQTTSSPSSSTAESKPKVPRKTPPSSTPSLSLRRKKAGVTKEKKTRKFFDPFTGEALWITSRDASKFFNVPERDLLSAGLRPRYGGGGLGGGGSYRWDLFDVYTHHATTRRLRHDEGSSSERSLDRFLQKNADREREIFGMLGLG